MTACTKTASVLFAEPFLLALGGPGQAACLDDERVAELVAGYPTAPISGIPPDLSLDDAYCTQGKYVALLGMRWGRPSERKPRIAAVDSCTGQPTPSEACLMRPTDA